MLRSKLYDVFMALPTGARRDLRQWVKSPFFNPRQDVADLYAYIDSHALRDVEALQKETVYKKIYGKTAYDDTKMRYIMSFLLRIIEQYLIFKQATSSDEKADLLLTQSYKQLNIEKHFGQSMERLRKKLKQGYTDSGVLLLEYDVEKMNFEFLNERKRVATNNMQTILSSLDRFYAAEKLKIACSALAYQAVFKQEFDMGFIEPVLVAVEQHEWHREIPAIGAYYYTYRMATQPDSETYFFLLKKELAAMQDVLSSNELRTIYRLLINYVIRRVNNSEEAFRRELFEIYKEGISKKILLENGEMTAFTYKNMVMIGIHLHEYDYIRYFIDEYRASLTPEHRRSYYQYCQASLLIALGRYDEAMPMLSQLNYGDIFLQLSANAALAKVYYTLNEFDVLASLLDSFRQLIHRKRDIVSYHSENYLNLIRFLGRLINLDKNNKTAIERLEKDIQTTSPLSDRAWLLTQIAQR